MYKLPNHHFDLTCQLALNGYMTNNNCCNKVFVFFSSIINYCKEGYYYLSLLVWLRLQNQENTVLSNYIIKFFCSKSASIVYIEDMFIHMRQLKGNITLTTYWNIQFQTYYMYSYFCKILKNKMVCAICALIFNNITIYQVWIHIWLKK